jgi:rare lipoprotein A
MLFRLVPVIILLVFGIADPAFAEITDAPPNSSRHLPRKPSHLLKKKARRHGQDVQVGTASLYGNLHGKRTASGQRYDHDLLTAAHRTLPLNSKVRVTNLANGRSVTVTVNDRGPHRRDRVIDLSQSAAEQIGMRHRGLATVRIEPLQTTSLPPK